MIEVSENEDDVEEHRRHLRHEAAVMALYVSVCLFAALTAVGRKDAEEGARALWIVWGTTIGLALAHAFAFRVSTPMISRGTMTRHDLDAIVAKLVGALAVATLATVPIALFPRGSEYEACRWTLALFIGVVGYLVSRIGGVGRLRSAAYGVAVFGASVVIALVKILLSGY